MELEDLDGVVNLQPAFIPVAAYSAKATASAAKARSYGVFGEGEYDG